MKKALLLMLICGGMLSASAQTTSVTDSTTHHYYYYPSSNVYFDQASGDYWYWDKGSSQWQMNHTLPSNITVTETDRYSIPYKGNDPWKNNAADIKKYKVKKSGKEKIKPKDKD